MAEETNQERQDNELEALKVGPTVFLTVPMKIHIKNINDVESSKQIYMELQIMTLHCFIKSV